MYGAFDNVEKDSVPRTFHKFKKDAEWEVGGWRKAGYHWAKKAGVRRVFMNFLDEVRVDVRHHEYKNIHL